MLYGGFKLKTRGLTVPAAMNVSS